MKKCFFVLTVFVALVATAVQASVVDTINAGRVSYAPIHKGKVVHIAKGDTAFIAGVDSIVVMATDTTTDSEKIAIYVDGKRKLTQWVKPGYTSDIDPSDSTKVVIEIVGGDANSPDSPDIAWGFKLFIGLIIVGGVYLGLRFLRII